VETCWILDGRKMTLLKELVYVDPNGINWVAPKGCVIDGASIPQEFWSVIGGPYSGKYREASVVHDIACNHPKSTTPEYCSGRKRPHKQTHRMFYDAILTSGVDENKAYLMYLAVRVGGPRWDKNGDDLKPFLFGNAVERVRVYLSKLLYALVRPKEEFAENVSEAEQWYQTKIKESWIPEKLGEEDQLHLTEEVKHLAARIVDNEIASIDELEIQIDALVESE
jgi:hypothetical protein